MAEYPTALDKLVNLVNAQSEISVKQVVRALRIGEKDIIEMAKILQEHDIVRIHYTAVGEIVLQKGAKLESKLAARDKTRDVEKDKETTEVSKMLNAIRKRIIKKKYGKSGRGQ